MTCAQALKAARDQGARIRPVSMGREVPGSYVTWSPNDFVSKLRLWGPNTRGIACNLTPESVMEPWEIVPVEPELQP